MKEYGPLKVIWKCLVCKKPNTYGVGLRRGRTLYHICDDCEGEAVNRIKKKGV